MTFLSQTPVGQQQQQQSKWLMQQRSTPSFVVAGRDARDSLLDVTLQHTPAAIAKTPVPEQLLQQTLSPTPTVFTAASTSGASPLRTRTPAASARSPAANNRPTTPIHERLLEKGRLYEQHLEGLREHALARDLRRCRSVPKISAMGHNIQRDSQIEVRLANVWEEKKQVAVFNMQILQKKEGEILQKWFHPTISSKGRRATSRTGRGKERTREAWAFKRQQRLEELQKEKILKEMDELRGTPDIDRRSQLLAARKREKEGLAGYTHLEAMLERDRLAKLARWEEQQLQQMSAASSATPRITQFAAALPRDEDVADRLLREAEEREYRRREREIIRLEEEKGGAVGSGRGGGTPAKFNAQTFLNRNEELLRRREARAQAEQEAERRMHTPNINPTSDHLAARRPESTFERLTTPPRTYSMPAASAHQQSPRPSASRRPAGSVNDSTTGENFGMYERMQLAEARRRLKLDAARSELAARELDDCTFAPQTTTHYYPPPPPRNDAHNDNPNYGSSFANSSASVYERMRQWQARRDDRLAQQRRDDEERDAQDLTFTPNARAIRSTVAPAQVTGPVDRLEDVPGMEAFMSRQEAARNARHPDEQHRSAIPVVGQNATAPVLGRERSPSKVPVVLSLQQPVSPAATRSLLNDTPQQTTTSGDNSNMRYSLHDTTLAQQRQSQDFMRRMYPTPTESSVRRPPSELDPDERRLW